MISKRDLDHWRTSSIHGLSEAIRGKHSLIRSLNHNVEIVLDFSLIKVEVIEFSLIFLDFVVGLNVSLIIVEDGIGLEGSHESIKVDKENSIF